MFVRILGLGVLRVLRPGSPGSPGPAVGRVGRRMWEREWAGGASGEWEGPWTATCYVYPYTRGSVLLLLLSLLFSTSSPSSSACNDPWGLERLRMRCGRRHLNGAIRPVPVTAFFRPPKRITAEELAGMRRGVGVAAKGTHALLVFSAFARDEHEIISPFHRYLDFSPFVYPKCFEKRRPISREKNRRANSLVKIPWARMTGRRIWRHTCRPRWPRGPRRLWSGCL